MPVEVNVHKGALVSRSAGCGVVLACSAWPCPQPVSAQTSHATPSDAGPAPDVTRPAGAGAALDVNEPHQAAGAEDRGDEEVQPQAEDVMGGVDAQELLEDAKARVAGDVEGEQAGRADLASAVPAR